jgi:LmbE family N-acetylglucosaminyl deacetylase
MTVGELIGEPPARALAVYAHPDDADVSCGGTLAAWCRAGSEVHLLVCTSGDKGSSDPATDPAELVLRRSVEVDEAAAVLGLASVTRLHRADGELENDVATRADIVAVIRSVRPDAVLCPDPLAVFFREGYFNHHDHRVAGWATLDAVAPAASSPLYFPERGSPHQVAAVYLSGSLEPNVLVDVSASIEAKVAAIQCHRSQLGDAGEWSRAVVLERAAEAGGLAGVAFAEPFRRLALID